MSKKRWVRGYISLPCFTVIMDRNTNDEATFTCADWLVFVWKLLFRPFWHGIITLYEDLYDEEDDE